MGISMELVKVKVEKGRLIPVMPDGTEIPGVVRCNVEYQLEDLPTMKVEMLVSLEHVTSSGVER